MVVRSFIVPIALVAAAMLTGVLLLTFVLRPSGPPAQKPEPRIAKEKPPRNFKNGGFDAVSSISSSGSKDPQSAAPSLAEDTVQPVQPWESAINRLLDSQSENNTVAAELAALLPSLPLEGQTEALQHMVNLLDDEGYGMAGEMLFNPGLHPELRAIIFSDALNRPNALKLPLLLDLLAAPGHPLRAEAHENLQIAVGRDFGQDPRAWVQAVEVLIREESGNEGAVEDSAGVAQP